jgi:dTMP kinase
MFITLEGPDGSGKTSQVEPLAEYLEQQGYSILVTREPGGTPIGNRIRTVLFNLEHTEMHPATETLLFLASRAQLVAQVIRPHLAGNGIVLSDRYADSTLAYQGYGHGNDIEQLRCLLDFATGGLKPDLTILFDLDVELGLRRRAGGGDWNRLDAYGLAFHQRVRDGYHQLVQSEPQRWVVIDAQQPPEQVQAAVRKAILTRLRAKPQP